MSRDSEEIKAASDVTHSGTHFVVVSGALVIAFLLILLLLSPLLRDRLGITDGSVGFDSPEETVTEDLLLDDDVFGTAIWDAQGVCAEISDPSGEVFRTCASPNSLRPIWAIDAPDEADPAYLLVATPNEIDQLVAHTEDDQYIPLVKQPSRDMPASWWTATIPEDAVIVTIAALDDRNLEVGDAQCDSDFSPSNGPERLHGGCLVPLQD